MADLPFGTETIDSLAGRIKAKYNEYAGVDNTDLVRRVTSKYPEYRDVLHPREQAALGYAPSHPEATLPQPNVHAMGLGEWTEAQLASPLDTGMGPQERAGLIAGGNIKSSPLGTIPVLDAPAVGIPQMGRGVKGLAQAATKPITRPDVKKQLYSSASDVIEGGFKTAEPALAATAVTAPAATVFGLGLAYGGGKIGENVTRFMGGGPEAQRLGANLGSVVVPSAAHRTLGRLGGRGEVTNETIAPAEHPEITSLKDSEPRTTQAESTPPQPPIAHANATLRRRVAAVRTPIPSEAPAPVEDEPIMMEVEQARAAQQLPMSARLTGIDKLRDIAANHSNPIFRAAAAAAIAKAEAIQTPSAPTPEEIKGASTADQKFFSQAAGNTPAEPKPAPKSEASVLPPEPTSDKVKGYVRGNGDLQTPVSEYTRAKRDYTPDPKQNMKLANAARNERVGLENALKYKRIRPEALDATTKRVEQLKQTEQAQLREWAKYTDKPQVEQWIANNEHQVNAHLDRLEEATKTGLWLAQASEKAVKQNPQYSAYLRRFNQLVGRPEDASIPKSKGAKSSEGDNLPFKPFVREHLQRLYNRITPLMQEAEMMKDAKKLGETEAGQQIKQRLANLRASGAKAILKGKPGAVRPSPAASVPIERAPEASAPTEGPVVTPAPKARPEPTPAAPTYTRENLPTIEFAQRARAEAAAKTIYGERGYFIKSKTTAGNKTTYSIVPQVAKASPPVPKQTTPRGEDAHAAAERGAPDNDWGGMNVVDKADLEEKDFSTPRVRKGASPVEDEGDNQDERYAAEMHEALPPTRRRGSPTPRAAKEVTTYDDLTRNDTPSPFPSKAKAPTASSAEKPRASTPPPSSATAPEDKLDLLDTRKVPVSVPETGLAQINTAVRDARERLGLDARSTLALRDKALAFYKAGIDRGDSTALDQTLDRLRGKKPPAGGSVGTSGSAFAADIASKRAAAGVDTSVSAETFDREANAKQAEWLQEYIRKNNTNDEGIVMGSGLLPIPNFVRLGDRFTSLLDRISGPADPELSQREAAQSIIRHRSAERELGKQQDFHELREAMKAHEGDSLDQMRSFMDSAEHKPGALPLSASDAALVSRMHSMWGELWESLKRVNPDRFEGQGIENYLSRIFTGPRASVDQMVARVLGKRPLQGPATFAHTRFHEFFSDALEAGAEPITNNPIKMQLMGMYQVHRYIAAHEMMGDLKSNGLAKYFKIGSRDIPAGWQKINDSIFQPRAMKAGGRVEYGNYWAPPEVAKTFNNFLSPGLRGEAWFDGIRQYSNFINQLQLGFSAFHGTFSTFTASVHDMAVGLSELANQRSISGLTKVVRGSLLGVSAKHFYSTGKALESALLNPGSDPSLADAAQAFKLAGARIGQDPFYDNAAGDAMRKAWREGRDLPAAIRGIQTATDFSSRWLMKYYVPRLKMGAFAEMATGKYQELLRAGTDQLTISKELGQLWDRVDDRFGQLTYDNLFWNKVWKDLGFLGVRSLGWNIGDIREIGGGLMDVGKQGARLLTGKNAAVTHRMTFLVALPIVAGMYGALMNYAFTGSAPDKLEDYFYPRTGRLDSNGKPERLSMPTYMRDIWGAAHAPLTTAGHKLHPWVEQIVQMVQNKDFYNVEIRHPDDSPLQQATELGGYLLKQLAPISWQGAAERMRSASANPAAAIAESEAGFTPAPKWVGESAAEQRAYELSERHREVGPRTTAEFEHGQAVGRLRSQLAQRDPVNLGKALQAGTIRTTDIDNIIQESTQTPLQRYMSRLNADEALEVWRVATPSERQSLRPTMIQKLDSIDNLLPEQQGPLYRAYAQAFRQ